MKDGFVKKHREKNKKNKKNRLRINSEESTLHSKFFLAWKVQSR